MSNRVVLEVKDLRTQFFTPYGTVHAVDGVSFDVSAGEVFGLVGESGSGKSVTALSILRLVPPPGRLISGEIRLSGRNLLELSQEEIRQARGDDVSLVFQDPVAALNPVLTIGWQLREAIQAHRHTPGKVARRKVIEALELVGIPSPEERYSAYPHEFSGGMNQRVVIAMGAVNEPGVLIADEPTTALDVTIQAQILELLKLLTREYGMGLVLITHNMAVVANMCDRVAVMYAGEIVEEAPVQDLFHSPLHPYTLALLRSLPRTDSTAKHLPAIQGLPPDMVDPPTGCRFRDRCPVAESICAEKPNLVELEPGRWARCWVSQRGGRFVTERKHLSSETTRGQTGTSEPPQGVAGEQALHREADGHDEVPTLADWAQTPSLLHLKGVVKHFSVREGLFGRRQTVHAVDGVDLRISPGETFGVVGESGCGKSTLARLIVGLYEPTAGSVMVDGWDLAEDTREAASRRRQLQMVFQDPLGSLNPRLRVGDSIAEPLDAQGSVGKTERRTRVRELLSMVGLKAELADRYPHELSGGQQQRVCIARALIANPSLVVADEAVSSLDVSLQAQVLNLFRDLQDHLGLTYVFISHDLAVVESISTQIGVMYLGKMVELAPTDHFRKRPLHPYSIALRSAVPIPDPQVERRRQRIVLTGDVPSPLSPPTGCRFHTRCPLVQSICRKQDPPLAEYQPGHWAACHFVGTFDELLRPHKSDEGSVAGE